MLEDTRLRIFETVAEQKSFTAAARELCITQPAVSQNIAELEKDLGVQLFVRARGEVALTAEGARFRGYARQILHWYGVAQQAFAKDDPLDSSKGSLFTDGKPAKRVVEPARLTLDDGRQIQIWTSGDDIHIEGL